MSNSSRPYVDIVAFNNEVTGSGILNTIIFPNGTKKKPLVDFGLFQESEYSKLNKDLPFDASTLNYVLITHNHVDHTGKLPFLVKNGYRGDIHMSESTAKLLPYALEDSYNVLKNNAEMLNEAPLYSAADVDETLKHVKGHPFEKSFWLDQNIKITFFMNGHLPGAVVILIQIKYDDYTNKHYDDINLIFTGDYNNKNMFFDVKPIPKRIHKLPVSIIQEATYGDMNSTDIEYVFEKNILDAVSSKKKILIPVFSLGRAQEVTFLLKKWQDEGKLDKSIPIHLDGKLAIKYTELYLRDGLDNKEECKKFLPENFSYISSKTERNSIIESNECSILLATSGMGSNGPCRSLIPQYLKNPNAVIHFTGYCAEGTMGRRLYDCEYGEIVDCCGLRVKKLATVLFTAEISAHAKADELIAFLTPYECIKLVLVNHGTNRKKDIYANRVVDEVSAKDVGILGRDYFYRIDAYGLRKTLTTKFQ